MANDVTTLRTPWNRDVAFVRSPRFDGSTRVADQEVIEAAIRDVEPRAAEWADFTEDTGCMYTFRQDASGHRVDSLQWHDGRGKDLTIHIDFPHDDHGEPITDPEDLEQVSMWTETSSQMYDLSVNVDHARSSVQRDHDGRRVMERIDLSGVNPSNRPRVIAERFKKYREDRGFVEGKSINSMHNYRRYVAERS